ncbi:MAG: HD domain-containing protein [Verrucomicrobia bacterium]|nr:HD domain-containing protein [Verrucomicrobiota bacterium]
MSAKPKPIGAAGMVIRDPVHGLIRIEPEDEVLLRLIDTPEFQRLRRIRQLGVSSFTYPGAEHSRFTHSLGVLNFAQRILHALSHRYRKDSAATDLLNKYGLTVKAAALLHDVGHSPFSHVMERVFEAVGNHEKKTIALITGKKSSIPKALERHKLDPKAVADIIEKTSEYRLPADIVSSQLDADRMDYILRDAQATGVKYGVFDAEWLLNCLCIGLEPGLPRSSDAHQWRLCLDVRRGLYSAEQLIIARMHMSLQVYFHKNTRRFEAHLLRLFRIASELAAKRRLPKGTPGIVQRFFETHGTLPHDEFLLLDEATLLCAVQMWSCANAKQHEVLASLAKAFLNREKVFSSRELKPLGFTKSTELEQELSKHGRKGVDWLLDEIPFNSYKDFGAVFREPEKAEKEEREAEISTSAILLASGELGAPSKPVEADSPLFQTLGQKPLQPVTRLYFQRRIAKPVLKILERV